MSQRAKEIFSIFLSAAAALGVFCFLFLGQGWNLILCMALAAVLYLALTLILKPSVRIGRTTFSQEEKGEHLQSRLGEAGEDYRRMVKAAGKIRDANMRERCAGLLRTAESILKYLEENPQKVTAARRYIDYYQETAANVLENYTELQKTGLNTAEVRRLKKSTEETVEVRQEAFNLQFEKLMQDELMDLETDLKLLQENLKLESGAAAWDSGKQKK